MTEIDNLRRKEELQLQSRWSTGLVVGGEVVLWMAFLVVWFTYMSVKDGSDFWVWWVLVEGLVGLAAIVGGILYRSHHVS
jgi:hypothetical protein